MAFHTKGKNKRKKYDHPPINPQGFKKSKKYFSNYECFTCHNMGHNVIKCPMKPEKFKKKKIFRAHDVEYNDQEDEEKSKENEYSYEEYFLIFALIGLVSLGNDTWLVYSGASKQ